MEYAIVTGTDVDELQKNVQAMLRTGWVPQGGVAVAGSCFYFQAMVRGASHLPPLQAGGGR